MFKASGRKLLFDGFYKAYGDNDKDKLLTDLTLNAPVTLSKLDANQHFTEPPSRYSEASLIKKLESLGIGRPSTYAPTVSVLVARDYIVIEKSKLCPQKLRLKSPNCSKHILHKSWILRLHRAWKSVWISLRKTKRIGKPFYGILRAV